MSTAPIGRSNNQTVYTPTEETGRVAFNPQTRTFGPMKSSNTRNIEQMNQVSSRVGNLPVPPDYTSQAFLTQVKTSMEDRKATPLESPTQGVTPRSPNRVIQSVRTAQRSL